MQRLNGNMKLMTFVLAVWQLQYGYYWTLFRVYDNDGNLIAQECYGFANAY